MNEDQLYNDHHLNINPCKCGNESPQLMGDDFDADILCEECGLYIDGFGTRGAISRWNKGLAEKVDWFKGYKPDGKYL